MPFNGSGTFVSLAPPNFPAVPGTVILASQFNNNMNDIFTSGLTNCMTRDGQSPPSNNIPMAGFKLTALGNGTADTDAAALGQVLGLRGQVGSVDWNTRILTGMFEATASSLGGSSSNFPPTSDLGMLNVEAQGAIITQHYITAWDTWIRQKISGTWTTWVQVRQSKNMVINSAFQAWQRGTSLGVTTGITYVADMAVTTSAGTTYAISQQNWPMGQVDVNSEALFFHRTVVASVAGASNLCLMSLPIESVRSGAGRQVTISFWAKADSAKPIAVEFVQNFGTGGTPSSSTSTPVFKPTLSTSWARYQSTITIPGLGGKLIGTSNTDDLVVNFWFDAGSSFNARSSSLGQQSGTFDLWGVKLEEGPAATPYVVPDFAINLHQCQRFYTQSGGGFAGFGSSAALEIYSYPYPVRMKNIPIIGIVNNGSTNLTNFSASTITTDFWNPTATVTAVGPGAWNISFSWTATASLA